jgi:hypothetical protein
MESSKCQELMGFPQPEFQINTIVVPHQATKGSQAATSQLTEKDQL